MPLTERLDRQVGSLVTETSSGVYCRASRSSSSRIGCEDALACRQVMLELADVGTPGEPLPTSLSAVR